MSISFRKLGFFLCFSTFICSSSPHISGLIVDYADKPISGVHVHLKNQNLTTQSDTNGIFALGMGTAIQTFPALKSSYPIRFSNSTIHFPGDRNTYKIDIIDSRGRLFITKSINCNTPMSFDFFNQKIAASGLFFCRISSKGISSVNRFTHLNSKINWQYESMAKSTLHQDLRYTGEVISDSLVFTKAGFSSFGMLVSNDTLSGLRIRLPFENISPNEPVTVRESTVTMIVSLPEKESQLNPDDGMYASRGYGYRPSGTLRYAPFTNIKLLIIENGLIRVVASPTLGMRVLQATDLIRKKNMFLQYDTIQGSRVWDAGGVEISWPFFEHSLQTVALESPTKFQSGGYRISKESDGSVCLAMNMNFSQYQDSAESALHGRYSIRPVSSWIRVAPGSSKFSVKYRADNPTPFPYGDRMWNDALFVKGSDSAQVIYPVRWAVHHFVNDTFDMQEFHGKPMVQWYDTTGRPIKRSLFAIGLKYPFAGMFYPEDDSVNRLRIVDPKEAPGLKYYQQAGLRFVEFWTGTNQVFEIPEKFANGFDGTGFEVSYFMTPSMGPVSYANDYLAISVDTIMHKFSLTAPIPLQVEITDFSGNLLGSGKIGPKEPPLQGTCQNNQIRIKTSSGVLLMEQKFPLPLENDLEPVRNLHKLCDRSFWGGGPLSRFPTATFNKTTDNRRGLNYELEGLQNNTDGLRDYQALRASDYITQKTATDSSWYVASIARVCLRYKRFERALKLCDYLQTTDNQNEADLIKGFVALERKQEPQFSQSNVKTNYFKALDAIKNNNQSQAINLLTEYTGTYPKAFRARLLLAYLKKDRYELQRLTVIDPASPELVWVASQLGLPNASSDLTTILNGNFGGQEYLDRFISEATKGVWIPLPYWKPFPSSGWGGNPN